MTTQFDFTRRSALRTLGSAALAAGLLGTAGAAFAAPEYQARQCQTPSRLRSLRPPYIARFTYRDRSEFLFLAARHSLDQRSPTHKLIWHLLSELRPTSLIVEGYVEDPARLLEQDLDLFHRGIYPENRYAVAMADSLNIPAVGGDLSPYQVARASLGQGFHPHDVAGTHIVRILSGQPSEGRQMAVEEMVRRDLKELYPDRAFNFREWYAGRVGEPLSDAGVRRIYKGPCGSGIIAEIASFESEARNRNILNILAAKRRTSRRSAAVFGANHLFSLFESLAADAAQVETLTLADLAGAAAG